MEAEKEFWLWTFFLIIFMTGSHCDQKQSPTSMRRNEQDLLKTVLSVLQQHVKDQDIKMKNLEKELISIKKTLSQCGAEFFMSSTTEKPSTSTTKIAPNIASTVMTNSMAPTSTTQLPTPMGCCSTDVSSATSDETSTSSSSTTATSEDTTTTKPARGRATRKSVPTTETNTASTVTTISTTPTSSIIQLPTLMGMRGKEFLILFMRNHPGVSGSLTVYITTNNDTFVNISTSPHLNTAIKSATDRIMNVSSYSNITLPHDLTCDYLTIETKAVLLQTSEISSVSIFDSFGKTTNDGTLIIPTNRLSTKYLVSSSRPYDIIVDYYSQFAVAALHDRTSVNIRFRMKTTSISLLGRAYRDNDVFTTTLDKYETLQVNHTVDLTGTFITSTKPTAVFSGNRCQQLKQRACSHMVTQLPPTTEYDNRYIVPTFYGNSGTLIQVITESQSSINISIGSSVSTWQINEKEYRNTEVTSDDVTVVESDNPVLVTGFAMGSSYNDPYMTVIPGINQYIDYYKVVVPEGYTNNYICVIIPQTFSNYLRINGSSADHFKTVRSSSAILETTFSVRTFEVNNGPIVVSTTNNSTFGLLAYGHRKYDGYAFAGNFVFS